MACEVSIQDIKKDIKNRLLDKFEGVKPSKGNLFVPINSGNRNFLGSQLDSYIVQLNREFGADIHGNSIEYYKENEFGYIVEINPPQSLADAMTEQNIRDEVGDDYYMGDNALRDQEQSNLYSSPRGQINYQFRAIQPIVNNLNKINNWAKQIKDQDTLFNKIQKDLGIPKDQVDLVRNSEGNTVEEKLTSFIANYSYTVNIETALDPLGENTDNYNRLTVPGGINYQENRIVTPNITPSIKGHAKFAQSNDIGWFRSDEGGFDFSNLTPVYSSDNIIAYIDDLGNEIKNAPRQSIRRILEVQSDLFQKGRGKQRLTKELTDQKLIGYDEDGDPITEGLEEIPLNINQNNFLQLLNKDNNWVTFFVKSIIQDSAKKGYEKVLFPLGDTASKIEGHTTLEEFKKQKEDRLAELENKVSKGRYVFIDEFGKETGTAPIEADIEILRANNPTLKIEKDSLSQQELNDASIEINQLKQELERVEREGFGALKPIYNFYENTVTNVLKKNGYNPVSITDEYGNTWNEIEVTPTVANQEIFLSRRTTGTTQQNTTQSNLNQPVGDNYVELVRWKRAQLEQIQNKKQRLRSLLRARDTAENRAKLKDLDSKERIINNHLEMLAANQVEFMFHAIIEDLNNLEQALENSDLHKIQDVREKLDFYEDFAKTLPSSGDYKADYDAVAGKIKRLNTEYSKLISKKVLDQLEQSTFVQNVIQNLNKDITDPTKKFTIEDLMVANSDIPWTDRDFLGIISSNTGDTILPQHLFEQFRTSLMRNTNRAVNFTDRLDLFNRQHNLQDKEWVYEKDNEGNKTGRLINVFSDKWAKALRGRNSRLKNYSDALFGGLGNTRKNYLKLVKWYKENAEVIDITRLSAVREVYGSNPEYSKYFKNSTDDRVRAYEDNLKKQLGPRFDDIVEQALNKLAKFEELKVDTTLTPEWRDRTIASHDVWKFLEMYKSGTPTEIFYDWSGGRSSVLFHPNAFADLPVLPKNRLTKKVVTDTGIEEQVLESGYYNPIYQEILSDPVKLEYWNILKDMSEYVNDTYNLNDGLTYAKVQDAYAERLLQDLKFLRKNPTLKKLGKMFIDLGHEYKSFFYEQGSFSSEDGVISNYSDKSKSEIRALAAKYMLKGMSQEEARKRARKEILDTYTPNLDNAMKASVIEAALHNARMETEPTARGILEVFKNIKALDETGAHTITRENAIKRLEGYIDKVIYNRGVKYRGSTDLVGQPINNDGWLEKIIKQMGGSKYLQNMRDAQLMKLLSEADKKILKELKSLKGGKYDGEFIVNEEKFKLQRYLDEDTNEYKYISEGQEVSKEQFDVKFDEYIQSEISKLGLDLNMAGLIDGVMKTVILKGLGLNPISGIFNRIEGKHSAMIMDLTGEYWPVGNIDVANQFMFAANLNKMSWNKFVDVRGRKEQVHIFQEVVDRLHVLQDRKKEIERTAETNRLDRSILNIFQFAVEHPEFKNQGAIMIAIMMDTEVLDNEGNPHKLFNKNTMEFTPFMLEDGVLTIRPEFNESFSFDSSQMESLVLRIEDAVSHSQGNYNQHDIMKIKRNVWGRAATTFMTWFPEQLNQRWGTRTTGDELNINLFTGNKRKDGRFVAAYKASRPAFMTYVLATLGLSYGALGMVGLIGTGILGAIVYQKFLKKVTNNGDYRRDANYIQESIQFLKSIVIESLNYPSRLLNTSARYRIKNNTFEGTNLTEDEINSMRAMTRELAIMLTALMIKMMFGALMYDDDDDKESPARMRYNFVQNQFSRAINALSVYTNPHALFTDNSRVALLSHLEGVWKLLDNIVLNPDMEKTPKALFDVTPLPRILTKDVKPWEDKMNFDEKPNLTGITPTMKWTAELYKNWDTGGEFSSKKEYEDMRKQRRDELREDALAKYGSNKHLIKAIVDTQMKQEFGTKTKEVSYGDAVKTLESGQILKNPKQKKAPNYKKSLVEKLKKLGLSAKDASKIAEEELE